MGMAETLMMVGVLVVGGYVALKVLPQLKLGQAQATPPPVTPVTPVAPVCKMEKCDEDAHTCQCTGQAAFIMGEDRDCTDCTTECTGRCGGTVGTAPDVEGDDEDNDDDDDDNDDDDNDAIDRVTQRAKEKQAITSASKKKAVAQKKKQCSSFSGETKKACEASYARARYSYRALMTAQTLNRIRRARLAQAYYNMNYDPSRII